MVTSHQRWLALAYQALHRGNRGDVEFYRQACRTGGHLLELGVGAGRVLLEVASGARSAYGVDHNPALLELAETERAKRALTAVRFVCADIANFELEERFDRVLIPYSGFWCLPARKKRQCLSTIRRHLAPGGLLLFDVYDASDLACAEDELIEEPDIDTWDFLVELPIGSDHCSVFERNVWWPSRQHLRVQYRLQSLAARAPESSVLQSTLLELDHYYLFEAQLQALLRRSGFHPHPLPHDASPPSGQLTYCWSADPVSGT